MKKEYGLFRYYEDGKRSKTITANNLDDAMNRMAAIGDTSMWRMVTRNVTDWEFA